MLNKYGSDTLSVAAMPLEGPEADRTLPAIPAVSATATAVEAAFRSDGIHILPFTRFSLPSTPLVPTPQPAHFAPSRGAICGPGPLVPRQIRHRHAPPPGAYTLAPRPVRLRPGAPNRRQQAEANYAQG